MGQSLWGRLGSHNHLAVNQPVIIIIGPSSPGASFSTVDVNSLSEAQLVIIDKTILVIINLVRAFAELRAVERVILHCRLYSRYLPHRLAIFIVVNAILACL